MSLQCLVVLTWMGADAPRMILVYPAARHVRICKLTPVHLLYAQVKRFPIKIFLKMTFKF